MPWSPSLVEQLVCAPGHSVAYVPKLQCAVVVVVAVSETANDTVALVSWSTNRLLIRFGHGSLKRPAGLRVLADGSGVVVADSGNNRVVLFNMAGEEMRSFTPFKSPWDVMEVDGGTMLLVVESAGKCVSKVNKADGHVVARLNVEGIPAAVMTVPVPRRPGVTSVVVLDRASDKPRLLLFE